jgi:integrase
MQSNRTAETKAGITKRHSRRCGCQAGGRCTCKPGWQANIWVAREKRRIRKTFPTRAAAVAWRRDAIRALEKGTMKAPTNTTLREAAEAWLVGAKDGSIRNRSGDPYKPSALRGYEQGLRLHILDDLGAARLSDITRVDVQHLADRMVGAKLHPSTIRNALMPLRAIYRRALSRGEVAVNPTTGIELPAVRGSRDRIASPAEAHRLIDAAPVKDRALWATAMYSGLRLGELKALRWADIDFEKNIITVARSWDPKAGEIETKSKAGVRTVPIAGALRSHLREHQLRQGRGGEGLAFGRSTTVPFSPTAVQRRTETAWRRAELKRITPHECRHTFASMMIAAGVNAKALSSFMGHANISITLDRYGHLMPGSEAQAAGLLDNYLAAAGGS